MRRTSMATALMVLVLASFARASDPIGIYGLVDQVVMEPSDGMAQRVQVWGVFTMADRQTRSYTEPVRGYLYYSLPSEEQETARTEYVEGAIARTLTGDIYRADDRAIHSVNRALFAQQTSLADRIRTLRPQAVLAPVSEGAAVPTAM